MFAIIKLYTVFTVVIEVSTIPDEFPTSRKRLSIYGK